MAAAGLLLRSAVVEPIGFNTDTAACRVDGQTTGYMMRLTDRINLRYAVLYRRIERDTMLEIVVCEITSEGPLGLGCVATIGVGCGEILIKRFIARLPQRFDEFTTPAVA